MKIFFAPNSAVALQPRPSGHITRCMQFGPSPSPKCSALPRTSHTPIPLYEICRLRRW